VLDPVVAAAAAHRRRRSPHPGSAPSTSLRECTLGLDHFLDCCLVLGLGTCSCYTLETALTRPASPSLASRCFSPLPRCGIPEELCRRRTFPSKRRRRRQSRRRREARRSATPETLDAPPDPTATPHLCSADDEPPPAIVSAPWRAHGRPHSPSHTRSMCCRTRSLRAADAWASPASGSNRAVAPGPPSQ
jgi:hypothetical protein